MKSSKPRYLLDVNVFLALLSENPIHHQLVTNWFNTPGLHWAICSFTEAGFLRHATAPRAGQITLGEATAVVARVALAPGYHHLPTNADWQTLSRPFVARLYGTKQVTDAYLLGLAVHDGLLLVTMDKAILHLAGSEYKNHVVLLRFNMPFEFSTAFQRQKTQREKRLSTLHVKTALGQMLEQR